MSKKLTLSSARDLIKRELGISAAALIARDDMNLWQQRYIQKSGAATLTASADMKSNSNYPWYEMHLGPTRIDIYTIDVRQGKFTDKMIALSITHENSSKDTKKYFYGDTLEYAAPYTEWKNREKLAMEDCWSHFHSHPIVQETKAEVDNSNNLHSDEILEKAAFDNFEGKLLQGHDMFQIRVFDHHGNYIPQSEISRIDETQLNWWIKEVAQGVNNNSEFTAGFSVFKWDRKDESWMDYCPDGENQLRYDTGRRYDGIHKNLIQELPDISEEPPDEQIDVSEEMDEVIEPEMSM